MSASGASAKAKNYRARGERGLSIEEIEQVLSLHPRIAPPQNILVLDGDFHTPKGATAVGLTPSWESTVLFASTADQETVTHELMHEGLGLGETMTRLVTPLMRLKERITLFPRPIKYEECPNCEAHPQLFAQYGLVPEDGGYPNVRHYRLTMG